jgi:hypothetical protein
MATTYRQDLVRLLPSGTPKVAIMAHFMSSRHLSAQEAIKFLRSAGIGYPCPTPATASLTNDGDICRTSRFLKPFYKLCYNKTNVTGQVG